MKVKISSKEVSQQVIVCPSCFSEKCPKKYGNECKGRCVKYFLVGNCYDECSYSHSPINWKRFPKETIFLTSNSGKKVSRIDD
jgi:hypothetical protein